ncbi:MAG: hypothetical protein HYX78_00215 [Armatimonadetes bacterium]|nr:hypothetical protein [Armatimonadota bacterium]
MSFKVRSRLRDESGNWTLIGLLVALAAAGALFFVVIMPKMGTGEQAQQEGLITPEEGQTVYGAAIDKGKETACSSNLRQIRMSIESYKTERGQPPALLQELKLGSGGMCPASGQPYQYDARTGQVICSTQGHQGL